jgi:hypothetical protein
MSIGYLSQNGMNTVFNQWATADPNINQYGFGQLYNENGEPRVKQIYPGTWVNPQSTSVDEYRLVRTYQIIIYDLQFIAEDGISNQNKIISDCEEIALRLIRFLKNKSEVFDVSNTPIIQPFTDKFLDDVSGVLINIDVEFNAEYTECEDPDYSFTIKTNEI